MLIQDVAPAAVDEGGGRDGPPGARGRPSLGASVGLLLSVVGLIVTSRRIGDNSFFTHLATGRHILEHGAVPSVDLYSFTAAGEPWVVQSWLASAVYAGLERFPGLWSVRALHGVLGAAIVALLWSLTAPVRSLVARIVLVSLPLGVGTLLWSPRPLLFGLVGLCVTLSVLARRLSPPWLLAVFALWAAVHGSFPLGLAVIAMTGIGAALDDRRVPTREAMCLLWAGLGTSSVVLGPLGFSGLWFPVRLLSMQDVLGEVVEWRPPSYRSPGEWLYVVLVVLVVGTLARRGATWRCLVPTIFAVVLGLTALRNLPIASLILVASVSPALAEARSRLSLRADDRSPVAVALAVAALVLGAAAVAPMPSAPALALDAYPVEQLAALEAGGVLTTPGARIVTHDYVGNYLTLRHGGAVQVFVDDRVDMYPAAVVQDYLTLLKGGDVQAVLDRLRPDVVLWRADGALRYWLEQRPEWDLVDDGEDYVVFCRAASPSGRPACR
jgi:hypothetical protein